MRACAATADQLDRGVAFAVSRPPPWRMFGLALSGRALVLVEELNADRAQLWVGVGNG